MRSSDWHKPLSTVKSMWTKGHEILAETKIDCKKYKKAKEKRNENVDHTL
jgi:hypothetical protein